ncbi:MAG: hypothetical protein IJ743_03050 [Bacilli bacterium]|nr:hypothetical protein [Bacilli bacterium]
MIWVCLKIFFARILDVSISTFRQHILFRGKIFIGPILAFFEVFIWFLVAREALLVSVDSIWIPISYSLGYATGTLLGSLIAKALMKGYVSLQVILNAENTELFEALKKKGYKYSLIHLDSEGDDKEMMLLSVQASSMKKTLDFILSYEENAFISISDSRTVYNGTLK